MMKFLKIITLIFTFSLLTLIIPPATGAFQYTPLPSDNLIKNPWFRGPDCRFSSSYWQTDQGQAPWGGSAKFQDPTDINCLGNWTGFAARFARNAAQEAPQEFYPNKNALLSQVVGPVNPADKILHFHFPFVAHRFNQLKAEIYSSNSQLGPWTSVWTVVNEQNCLTKDCANGPFNQFCMDTRECLCDLVTDKYLGSLNPLTKTISQGYPYYKIEFLANYPEPDGSATGDVGVKIVRVYFKVSEDTGNITPSLSPAISPTSIPTLPKPSVTDQAGSRKPGDANSDGKVDGLDYVVWLINYNLQTTGAGLGDFNNSGYVDGLDYVIWLNNYDF